MCGAGTNTCDAFVTLIGSKASTGKLRLEGLKEFIDGGLNAGTHQDMIIETECSLGDVLVVTLGIEGKVESNHEWFVQYIKVIDFTKEMAETQFPCYHWIKSHTRITTTAGTSKY